MTKIRFVNEIFIACSYVATLITPDRAWPGTIARPLGRRLSRHPRTVNTVPGHRSGDLRCVRAEILFVRAAIRVDHECHDARGLVRSGIGDGGETLAGSRQPAEVVAVNRNGSVAALYRGRDAIDRVSRARVTLRNESLAERNRRHFVLTDSPVPDFAHAGIRIESANAIP